LLPLQFIKAIKIAGPLCVRKIACRHFRNFGKFQHIVQIRQIAAYLFDIRRRLFTLYW